MNKPNTSLSKIPRSSRSSKALKTIGLKLYAVRIVKKIELKEAASGLRMSVTRLQSIEAGEKDYSLEVLVRMCDYYKVNVLDIVGK